MATNGKYALITGATSGIGYELAKLFAKDGYNLIIVARGTDGGLEQTATELKSSGIEVITLAKDLFKREDAFSVYDEVKAKGIEIDVLVNDAGQGLYGLFTETELERELNIIQLNVASLVILTKKFLQDMVARGNGKILNLSSMASKSPGPWQSVYHGTKAFVQSFSEAIYNENKEKGVTVTALLPGPVDTDFFNKADMNESKAVQDKSKLYDPADVAKDGYEALMNGDDKVISGLKIKMQVAMSNMTTDSMAAENTRKMQEPVGTNS
jgi:short-subunit dehydrogenase